MYGFNHPTGLVPSYISHSTHVLRLVYDWTPRPIPKDLFWKSPQYITGHNWACLPHDMDKKASQTHACDRSIWCTYGFDHPVVVVHITQSTSVKGRQWLVPRPRDVFEVYYSHVYIIGCNWMCEYSMIWSHSPWPMLVITANIWCMVSTIRVPQSTSYLERTRVRNVWLCMGCQSLMVHFEGRSRHSTSCAVNVFDHPVSWSILCIKHLGWSYR